MTVTPIDKPFTIRQPQKPTPVSTGNTTIRCRTTCRGCRLRVKANDGSVESIRKSHAETQARESLPFLCVSALLNLGIDYRNEIRRW
jgi:hypothetical protein